MKKRRSFKPATLLVILAISAIPVFAQPGQGQGRGQGQGGGQGRGQAGGRQMSEENVKRRVAITADSLKLSDKQESQVLEFEMDYYKTLQKERQSFNPETGDREAMRARMGELREERDAKYKEVLTKAQYEHYTRMSEARRSQYRQRQDGGQGSGERPSRGRGRGGN